MPMAARGDGRDRDVPSQCTQISRGVKPNVAKDAAVNAGSDSRYPPHTQQTVSEIRSRVAKQRAANGGRGTWLVEERRPVEIEWANWRRVALIVAEEAFPSLLSLFLSSSHPRALPLPAAQPAQWRGEKKMEFVTVVMATIEA